MTKIDMEKLSVRFKDAKKDVVFKTKSAMFRALYEHGMDIADIARQTNSHYSFVYGVVSSSCEMRKSNKVTKSDKIRELAAAGKTPGQIAKELNSNYSFVHTVVKKWKESQEEAAK